MTKISAGHTLLFNDPVPNSSGSESGGSRTSGTSNGQKTTPSFPFIIGIGGGSSSGKSEVCERIVEALGQNGKSTKERQVFVINQDSFYRKFNERELKNAAKFEFNFDHPNAVDLEKLKECMRAIKRHEPVTISHYNYRTHSLNKDDSSTLTIHSADVVIVEGILVFYDKEMRELFDLKLFVDTDSDTRLARRVLRDTEERSRNIESVLSQYIRFVKPAFEEFCLPTKKYADVIIPRGNDNNVAVSLIVQHIQDLLQCNAANNSRRSSIRGAGDSSSRSSGSSRGSSIPGSPLNKSLDHISTSSNQTSKTNQVSKAIINCSSSTSRSPVNSERKSHPTRSSPTSSSSCKRTKGGTSQTSPTKPTTAAAAVGGTPLSINSSSHVKAMPCHVEEFPALRGPQYPTNSNPVNFTNSVH